MVGTENVKEKLRDLSWTPVVYLAKLSDVFCLV